MMRRGKDSIVNGWHISGFSDVGVGYGKSYPRKRLRHIEAINERGLVPCLLKQLHEFEDSDQASTIHIYSSCTFKHFPLTHQYVVQSHGHRTWW